MISSTGSRVVRMLRRSGKPVVLAANKVDSPAQEGDAATLWNLGLGEPSRSRPCTAGVAARSSTPSWRSSRSLRRGHRAPEGDLHRIALVYIRPRFP